MNTSSLQNLNGALSLPVAKELWAMRITTPVGPLFAWMDEKALHALVFEDTAAFQQQEAEFADKKYNIRLDRIALMEQLEKELENYFVGELQEFSISLFVDATPFQRKVWEALQQIPYGRTASYKAVARAIGNPLASRAVGTANGANKFLIIVPCHRVVAADGGLGGYSSGLERKKWLLQHEQQMEHILR